VGLAILLANITVTLIVESNCRMKMEMSRVLMIRRRDWQMHV
jgi:hypothetical protein